MSKKPDQTLTAGEKKVVKDLEKIYVDSTNLYYIVEENGHIIRIDLDLGGNREPEVTIPNLPDSFINLKWLRILRIREMICGNSQNG